MTEDEVVKLCRQPESSISLRKEGLEVNQKSLPPGIQGSG